MEDSKNFKLNLIENAFDYFNSSLEFVIRANKTNDIKSWKFAIIHIVMALELFFKEILREANPLLIYANLDNYKEINSETKTVSWDSAVERLKYLHYNEIINIDKGRLALAKRLRNQMVHYDVNLEFPKVYKDYANLMNFMKELYNSFIYKSTNKNIGLFIYKENLEEELIINEYFNTEFVIYKGYMLSKDFMEEQLYTHVEINSVKYKRIRFGDEPLFEKEYIYPEGIFDRPCHDCETVSGLLHLNGCDMERCPHCGDQLLKHDYTVVEE